MAQTMLHDGMPAELGLEIMGRPRGDGAVREHVLAAERIEQLTCQTATTVNAVKIDRMLAAEPMSFAHDGPARRPTLRDALQPLFCDNEIALATSADFNFTSQSREASFPRDLFLNRLLVPLRDTSTGELTLMVGGTQAPGRARLKDTSGADNQDFDNMTVTLDGRAASVKGKS